MLRIQRIYTDFDHFDDEGGLPYGKAFVNAIKWLYDEEYFKKVSDYDYECYMRPCLPLYDFISLVTAFVCNAFGDLAKEKITSYIDALEEGSGGYSFEGQEPEYTYKEDIITIRKMKMETTGVVLWASYIYCLMRSEVDEAGSPGKFHKAADMFFKLFRRKIPLNDEALKKHILMKHRDETMRTFAANILSSSSNATPTQQKKAASSETEEDRLNALNQRVQTLQAENRQLKEDLAAEKEKNTALVEEHRQKASTEQSLTTAEDMSIELLSYLFKENGEETARDFYKEVVGKDDPAIADVVKSFEEKFRAGMKNVQLWRILHAARIYHGIQRNFDTALRQRQFEVPRAQSH